MVNRYVPCTKCGENKRGMFCDECTLPHCDDCGDCEITAPRIWQDVLEDLEGFPLDLVLPTVHALSGVRDDQLERLRKRAEQAESRLDGQAWEDLERRAEKAEGQLRRLRLEIQVRSDILTGIGDALDDEYGRGAGTAARGMAQSFRNAADEPAPDEQTGDNDD